jgi:hypothetical protein
MAEHAKNSQVGNTTDQASRMVYGSVVGPVRAIDGRAKTGAIEDAGGHGLAMVLGAVNPEVGQRTDELVQILNAGLMVLTAQAPIRAVRPVGRRGLIVLDAQGKRVCAAETPEDANAIIAAFAAYLASRSTMMRLRDVTRELLSVLTRDDLADVTKVTVARAAVGHLADFAQLATAAGITSTPDLAMAGHAARSVPPRSASEPQYTELEDQMSTASPG